MREFLFVVGIILGLAIQSDVRAQSTAMRRGDVLLNIAPSITNLGPGISINLESVAHYKSTFGVKTGCLYHSDAYRSQSFEYAIPYAALQYNYHLAHLFGRDRRMDYYAGLSAGYSYWHPLFDEQETVDTDYFIEDSRLIVHVQAGMRFFFKRKSALWIELSAGSWISANAGITFTF